MCRYSRFSVQIWSVVILLFVIAISMNGQTSKNRLSESLMHSHSPVEFSMDERFITSKPDPSHSWLLKLDPGLRSLAGQDDRTHKRDVADIDLPLSKPLSAGINESGELMVSVFVKTNGEYTPNVNGLEVQSRVGDIIIAGLPVSSLEYLARDPDVIFIDASMERLSLNNVSRTDIGATLVHQGIDLPTAYRGNGVIVGVIDSGIDFTHPDFSNNNGTRIQYLLEFEQQGQKEWTKQQIDSNPGLVTQRDLNPTGGHGTHVTGSAAGGGIVNPEFTGIAPEADIIFIKGWVGGGFQDVHVVSGCQYIFNKAEQMGKPAVINLSLGGYYGPLDGSSLYEQALSSLTGPGKIIVAGVGNSGFDLIHAGAQLHAGTRNSTILLTDNPHEAGVNMWYKPGVISHVAVAAFKLDQDNNLIYLSGTDFVPPGVFLNFTPVVYNNSTLGYVSIDARTTSDPRNGDGNIAIEIAGDPNNNIKLDETIWVIVYDSGHNGKFDMWSFGGEFWPETVGFIGINEITGDSYSTVGAPATAHKTIAVGSYITKNSWTNIDNNTYYWRNPDLTRQTDEMLIAEIGQISHFSSMGPTRDGRIIPDIMAPGELVFSTKSSHLTQGEGYQRELLLSGGRYLGMEGTSMSSPHVAGIIALMLQVNPSLTYEDIVGILRETARSDSWTGNVPNNTAGFGKLNGHAAVMSVAGTSPGTGDPAVLRYFDPKSAQKVWMLDHEAPIDSGFVFGTNRYGDRSKATAFTLPGGRTEGLLSNVNVWFGYKREGLSDESYSITIYNGTAEGGPVGFPIASKQYLLKDINADNNFDTDEEATVHTFNPPVKVGKDFFVSVGFGEYGTAGIGNAGIVSTDFLGVRVPEVWEQWQDGTWLNLSDAWFGEESAFGSGTDGFYMWMEANINGGLSVTVEDLFIPSEFYLSQNYPNPFNPSTTIVFSIPEESYVKLVVYDVLGRAVSTLVDDRLPAGKYSHLFQGGHLASGIYLYKLQTDVDVAVKRLVILK